MNKKGSHVGIVISFLIFITFVLFIYLIVQPSLSGEEKRTFLESLEQSLIKESTAELTTASVKLSGSPDGSGCFQLDSFMSETGMGENITAKNDGGTSLTTEVSGNNLEITDNGDSFFRVYYSEEFSPTSGSLSGCDSLSEGGGYDIGLLKTNDEIFESKIKSLIQDYKNNLDGLKEVLDFPDTNEFGLNFTYSNGTSISVGQEEVVGTSVFVGDRQIQYISESGLKEIGKLNVRVW